MIQQIFFACHKQATLMTSVEKWPIQMMKSISVGCRFPSGNGRKTTSQTASQLLTCYSDGAVVKISWTEEGEVDVETPI